MRVSDLSPGVLVVCATSRPGGELCVVLERRGRVLRLLSIERPWQPSLVVTADELRDPVRRVDNLVLRVLADAGGPLNFEEAVRRVSELALQRGLAAPPGPHEPISVH